MFVSKINERNFAENIYLFVLTGIYQKFGKNLIYVLRTDIFLNYVNGLKAFGKIYFWSKSKISAAGDKNILPSKNTGLLKNTEL